MLGRARNDHPVPLLSVGNRDHTVQHGTNKADEALAPVAARRDAGMSFLEILIAIVLLGTVSVGVLAAVRASVAGTRIERDHAKSYQWLQSANAVLQDADRVGCTYDPVADAAYADGEEKVRLLYQDIIRTDVANPVGWEDSQLTVLYPVKIWDGSQYWEPSAAPKPCFDSDGYLLQLITIQVTNPDDEIIETIQVVKRD